LPALTEQVRSLSSLPPAELERMVADYDNQLVLRQAVEEIQEHLQRQFLQCSGD